MTRRGTLNRLRRAGIEPAGFAGSERGAPVQLWALEAIEALEALRPWEASRGRPAKPAGEASAKPAREPRRSRLSVVHVDDDGVRHEKPVQAGAAPAAATTAPAPVAGPGFRRKPRRPATTATPAPGPVGSPDTTTATAGTCDPEPSVAPGPAATATDPACDDGNACAGSAAPAPSSDPAPAPATSIPEVWVSELAARIYLGASLTDLYVLRGKSLRTRPGARGREYLQADLQVVKRTRIPAKARELAPPKRAVFEADREEVPERLRIDGDPEELVFGIEEVYR